jgi:hypothetical protein
MRVPAMTAGAAANPAKILRRENCISVFPVVVVALIYSDMPAQSTVEKEKASRAAAELRRSRGAGVWHTGLAAALVRGEFIMLNQHRISLSTAAFRDGSGVAE